MKLSEVIQRLSRNRANEAHPDIELFSQTLNVYGTTGWSETFNNRMKGWYIDSWLCTDTTVGTAVYFFDDEPVAVGTQTARKSPEVLYFLSQEAADRVRDFLLEIIQAESVNHVPYIDPETYDLQWYIQRDLYEAKLAKQAEYYNAVLDGLSINEIPSASNAAQTINI